METQTKAQLAAVAYLIKTQNIDATEIRRLLKRIIKEG